jgi:outer membrane receptor protein involved in Fe transport
MAGVGHTFVPSLDDLTNPTPYRANSYNAFDFLVGHTFNSSTNSWYKGLQVQLGINNAFNDYPPYIPSEGNQSHDINAYDPIGRYVYAQVKYKF